MSENIIHQGKIMQSMIQYDFQDIPCQSWSKYKFLLSIIDVLIFINEIKKQKCQEWTWHIYINSQLLCNKYRITAVLKVETDIITSIGDNLMRRVAILVIMYVKTFKMEVIVFIGIKRHNVTSHWPIISSIRVTKLILTKSLNEIKRKTDVHFTDQ
jgi:hypothetical protein